MSADDEAPLMSTRRLVIDRYGGFLTAENVANERIDKVAQASLLRLAQGSLTDRLHALALVAAVLSGALDSIVTEDSPAARDLANERGDEGSSALIARGCVAALVEPPDSRRSPVIVFRPLVDATPAQIDGALSQVIDANIAARFVQAGAAQASDPTLGCSLACTACALFDIGCAACQECLDPTPI